MMAAEKGASKNTVLSYERDLRLFSEGVNENLLGVSSDTLRDYLAQMERDGIATSTAARKLSALRQFYKFLLSEGIIKNNPTANLESPRKVRQLPKILTEDDVTRLIVLATKKTEENPCFRTFRLRALIETLYATGLRASELLTLPLNSVQGDRRFIVVKGKGGSERMVPLSKHALEAIKDYGGYLEVDEKWKGSKYLFPSRGVEGHLSRIRLYQLLKELALEAGIMPSHMSAHLLRHAFATHLLAHGADLRSVQKMLGHADISTTQIYTHILDERLKALVIEKHPLSPYRNQ